MDVRSGMASASLMLALTMSDCGCGDGMQRNVRTTVSDSPLFVPQALGDGEWMREVWTLRGSWSALSGPWAGKSGEMQEGPSDIQVLRLSAEERTFAVAVRSFRRIEPVQVEVDLKRSLEPYPPSGYRLAYDMGRNAERIPLLTVSPTAGATLDIGDFLAALPLWMPESASWSATIDRIKVDEVTLSLVYASPPPQPAAVISESRFAGAMTLSGTSGRPLRLWGRDSRTASTLTRTNERDVRREEVDYEIVWSYGRN